MISRRNRAVNRRDLHALACVLGAFVVATPAACSSFGSNSEAPPTEEGGVDTGVAADAAPAPDGSDASPSPDSAPPPPCDKSKPFGQPVLIDSVRTTYGEKKGRLTPDELTIYFTSNHLSSEDIWVATRPALGAAFGAATQVPVLNTAQNESDLMLSADGTFAIFGSDRTGGLGQHDLWTSLRNAAGFGVPTALTAVNNTADEGNPFLATDGLWFTSSRGGVYAIWHAPKAAASFGAPIEVTELTSGVGDFSPVLTGDRLTLYFGSRRTGGFGTNDIWRARRADPNGTFANVENVTELNSTLTDNPSWLSPDECRLYLESDRDDTNVGTTHLYVAARPPL